LFGEDIIIPWFTLPGGGTGENQGIPVIDGNSLAYSFLFETVFHTAGKNAEINIFTQKNIMLYRYKIANWNVERPQAGTLKTSLALNKIAEIHADLIVLTETSDAMELSGEYPNSLKSKAYERTPEEQWVTIWSKWKLLEEIKTFDPFRTVCGIFNTPFGDTIVFGTIIPYHMAGVSGERYGNLGYLLWEYHEKDLVKQGENWKKLLEERKLPLMVIGDFNQSRGTNRGYGTRNVRDLLTGILKDLDMTCVTEGDFSGRHLTEDPKTGRIRNNIDHICISNSLLKRMKDYRASAWDHFSGDGRYMSDHNGVYIDFDI